MLHSGGGQQYKLGRGGGVGGDRNESFADFATLRGNWERVAARETLIVCVGGTMQVRYASRFIPYSKCSGMWEPLLPSNVYFTTKNGPQTEAGL